MVLSVSEHRDISISTEGSARVGPVARVPAAEVAFELVADLVLDSPATWRAAVDGSGPPACERPASVGSRSARSWFCVITFSIASSDSAGPIGLIA
ncbi:hypothetical protein D3C87_1916070 [compost metagenome]